MDHLGLNVCNWINIFHKNSQSNLQLSIHNAYANKYSKIVNTTLWIENELLHIYQLLKISFSSTSNRPSFLLISKSNISNLYVQTEKRKEIYILWDEWRERSLGRNGLEIVYRICLQSRSKWFYHKLIKIRFLLTNTKEMEKNI